jgi:hypothetical protein
MRSHIGALDDVNVAVLEAGVAALVFDWIVAGTVKVNPSKA